jgi:ADP-heptose:LPS heptosyltransferase
VFEHPAALAGAPVNWPALRRILVVRPDNLGDVLLTGPALAALRAAAPHARIDLLASPGGAAAATLLPEISEVVVARVSWQQIDGATGQDPDPDADLVAELAGRGHDAAVLLTSFSQSPWPAAEVCRRAGIPIRAGLSKEFGGTALTHWVPAPDDGLHQVDRALHLLGRLGVPAAARTLHAAVPAAGRCHARDALAGLGLPAGPYAVLLPGASCPSRRYRGFREVAAGLGARLPVVVSGPAAEEELVRSVAEGLPGVHPLPGALDVPGLAGLLAGAAVAVTNNSGGMHLADAVGTPVAVLFAGTEEVDQYRPRSAPAAVLNRPVSCSPCRQFRCPFALECLDVPPDEVVAAALGLASITVSEVSGVESGPTGIPVP